MAVVSQVSPATSLRSAYAMPGTHALAWYGARRSQYCSPTPSVATSGSFWLLSCSMFGADRACFAACSYGFASATPQQIRDAAAQANALQVGFF